MEWLKGADRAVKITMLIICGVLALGVLAAYVVLTLNGEDTTEFRQWIIGVANLLLFPVTGLAAVASVSAANSAKKAEENTNGKLHTLEAENTSLRAQVTQETPRQDF